MAIAHLTLSGELKKNMAESIFPSQDKKRLKKCNFSGEHKGDCFRGKLKNITL
jgi:hypothetical protein